MYLYIFMCNVTFASLSSLSAKTSVSSSSPSATPSRTIRAAEYTAFAVSPTACNSPTTIENSSSESLWRRGHVEGLARDVWG